VITDTVDLVGEKDTKPIGQIGDVSWERDGVRLAQQLARHDKELPAKGSGVNL